MMHTWSFIQKKIKRWDFYEFFSCVKKEKSILLHSLYMDSAEYQKKKSARTLLMQNAPAYTPEVQVSQTSNNSIPENPENVNTNERNSKVTMSKAPLCKGSCCEATEGL